MTFIQCCCTKQKSGAICATLLLQTRRTALSVQPWLRAEKYNSSSNSWTGFVSTFLLLRFKKLPRRRTISKSHWDISAQLRKLKTACKTGKSSIIPVVTAYLLIVQVGCQSQAAGLVSRAIFNCHLKGVGRNDVCFSFGVPRSWGWARRHTAHW